MSRERLVGGVLLVGGIVLMAALALLVGTDPLASSDKARRAASFTECETYCRATPLSVRFDRNGSLLECRCDLIFPEVE